MLNGFLITWMFTSIHIPIADSTEFCLADVWTGIFKQLTPPIIKSLFHVPIGVQNADQIVLTDVQKTDSIHVWFYLWYLDWCLKHWLENFHWIIIFTWSSKSCCLLLQNIGWDADFIIDLIIVWIKVRFRLTFKNRWYNSSLFEKLMIK